MLYAGSYFFSTMSDFIGPRTAKELILFLRADSELVERADQVLDQRVEVRPGHAPGRRGPSSCPSPCTCRGRHRLADLIDQVPLNFAEPLRVGRSRPEEVADALVGGASRDELVDHRGDRRLPPSRSYSDFSLACIS